MSNSAKACEQRAAIGAQVLVGELLLDRLGVGSRLVDLVVGLLVVVIIAGRLVAIGDVVGDPFSQLGDESPTLAAISLFQPASNRAVASSRCRARRFSRAVPISGLSRMTRRSPRLTFCPSTAWTSRTMPAARGRTSTCRSALAWIMPTTPTSVASRSTRAGSVAILASWNFDSDSVTDVAAGRPAAFSASGASLPVGAD